MNDAIDTTSLIPDLLSRCTFPEQGEIANCAVSGGADSLAMMLLAVRAGCAVTAFHVDHGLREGSDSEAELVREAADRCGAEFVPLRVDLQAGPNQEARARAARRSVLPDDALFAHTADDQAETVLMNLLRGSGLRGQAGIRKDQHPILSLRRYETHALCAEYGFEPVVDVTNSSPEFRRNRIRLELLPLIDEIAERDVAQILARNAAVAADEDEFLDYLASAIDPTDAKGVAAAPTVLSRRAIRAWLTPYLADDLGEIHPPSSAAVERVLQVAKGEVLGAEVALGIRIRRSKGKLEIVRQVDSSRTDSA